MTNKEIRAEAWESLKGNWGIAIVVIMIANAVNVIPSIAQKSTEGTDIYIFVFLAATLFNLLIQTPLSFGMMMFFLKLIRNESPSIDSLAEGFRRWGKVVLLILLMGIKILAWTLLLIIPGIVAALNYSQSFFILYDNPDMSVSEAIKESIRLMNGKKWKLVGLGLSFIGWLLLGVLTCCIGLLWVLPYMYTAYACFYQDLIDSDKKSIIPEPVQN